MRKCTQHYVCTNIVFRSLYAYDAFPMIFDHNKVLHVLLFHLNFCNS